MRSGAVPCGRLWHFALLRQSAGSHSTNATRLEVTSVRAFDQHPDSLKAYAGPRQRTSDPGQRQEPQLEWQPRGDEPQVKTPRLPLGMMLHRLQPDPRKPPRPADRPRRDSAARLRAAPEAKSAGWGQP